MNAFISNPDGKKGGCVHTQREKERERERYGRHINSIHPFHQSRNSFRLLVFLGALSVQILASINFLSVLNFQLSSLFCHILMAMMGDCVMCVSAVWWRSKERVKKNNVIHLSHWIKFWGKKFRGYFCYLEKRNRTKSIAVEDVKYVQCKSWQP